MKTLKFIKKTILSRKDAVLKNYSWKLITAIAVIIVSATLVAPTFKQGIWPYKKINLGLDLQGGMHLVLDVQSEVAVEKTLERMSEEIRVLLKREQIQYDAVKFDKDSKSIEIGLKAKSDKDKLQETVKKEFGTLKQTSESLEGETYSVKMAFPDEEIDHIKKMSVDQALETIRNRIDEFGVAEPDIRRHGEKGIIIQLPGIQDPQRAKDLIGKTALLEFKLVDDSGNLTQALEGTPPPGTQILYQNEKDMESGNTTPKPYLIKKQALLAGDTITDARVQIDTQNYNKPYVTITFDKKGSRIFERITGDNIQKRLAIILDNKIYSAPVIQDKIGGGTARITGNFSMEEAKDLAVVLRAGALPAPVVVQEERIVGPGLGADSIRLGVISALIGSIAVILFMLIYYKIAGIIANIALIVNILVIGAALALLGATLTLPGIAGIILTIGIAVDANVLIYERIREELRSGKPVRAAVSAGYERATMTILDANVTTLISTIVLFQFGTGPVKGFAVTLTIGVLASMYTAILLTRGIFEMILSDPTKKTISI